MQRGLPPRAARTLNPDFIEFLAALLRADARFLIVGAHAMGVHGVPRATGDLDVWVAPDPDNAQRVWAALLDFGAPVGTLGLSARDLATERVVVQMGVPPRRIDVLTSLTGLQFDAAWRKRRVLRVDDLDLPFLGREALLRNKRETGRSKDLADADTLDRQGGPPDGSRDDG